MEGYELKKALVDIMNEMGEAVLKHGEDHVEISISENQEEFCIMYHSRHDSHGIGGTYLVSDYGLKSIIDECNKKGFDYMEN